ncbi:MAG: PDZ domain-containing protein [Nitrospirae bacterium]|nr:PDZ domain-containing protein [Nitrospirota bacterium]
MMMRLRNIMLTVFLVLVPVVSLADDTMPLHELHVRFDPEKNILAGESRLTLPPGRSWLIRTGGITVTSVSVTGAAPKGDAKAGTIMIESGSSPAVASISFTISYAPVLPSGREDGIEQANVAGADGTALTGTWYPVIDGLTVFRLTVLLPRGFEGMSEADSVLMKERPDGFREFSFMFDHPTEGISLIAGKYRVRTVRHKSVDIAAYFFPEDEELGERYIEYTKKYLDMYDDLIGPYPYRRFAIVENILPTGYSMPTFTLLGRDVVRLPFIVETSLGHEILHQWFGNSVYADRATGNWSEGLTTYLADHQYEELKGKGWEYRKQALISYRNSVTPESDFSLREFSSRSDKATASVGYGKTAMVFHMLRQELGPDIFARALREFYAKNRFSRASWQDIQKACEAVSGMDLGWFFRQWVDGKGTLDFRVTDAAVRYEGPVARVYFSVKQRERKDRFLLPVILKTDKGEMQKVFRIEKESESLEIETAENPQELIVDGDYDLLRTLSGDETPPVLSAIFGDQKRLFVIPRGKEKEYAGLSGVLKENGFTEKKEEDVTYDDIKNTSMLVPAGITLVERIFSFPDIPAGDFSLVTKFSPYGTKSCIGIVRADSIAVVKQYLQRITHYGKYTNLAFSDRKNTEKTVASSERGIGILLSEEVRGIGVPQLEPMSRIIDGVSGKDIVYVGEFHDRFDNHRSQLRVIRELYQKNRKLVIGMEMFQKPFQNVLDDYIAGTIDERTFLKRSEYYKRWAFDYNLYREIMLFARENRIPVIALNIRKEIVSKVSKEGLQALSAEEMKEVPGDIDLSDMEYKERLRETYARHANPEGRNFDFFYQSQVLWDESMAHNLNEFMSKNPGYQAVVLAGVGHMAFGSGIPKRSFRLNRRDYAVILNSADVEQGIADFILFPSPVPFMETPRLGVQLKDEGGAVTISMVSPEGAAEKAGLRGDDVIISLDGQRPEVVEDVKIHLLHKKKGDTVVMKVKRKRFLLGDKEMEFKITL